jgi:hypothetical protein
MIAAVWVVCVLMDGWIGMAMCELDGARYVWNVVFRCFGMLMMDICYHGLLYQEWCFRLLRDSMVHVWWRGML